jgi:hypothetical protein
MNKTKYNFELLQTVIKRDNAFISENKYKDKHLNGDSFIKFNCSCGENDCEKRFKQMFKEGGAYCKKCTNKNMLIKLKDTMIKKYGVEYSLQNEEVRTKQKNTNLERYGFEHALQNKEIKEKSKKTCLEKYGVEFCLQNKEVREKGKETNLKLYGVENPFQNEIIKQQIKFTCLNKYGVEHHLKLDEFKEKQKETCLERYKVENPLQNKEIKEKQEKTCLEKYGVKNVSHNSDIVDKISKNAYKRKEIVKSNGEIIYLQGYEPQAYKILIEIYKEDEIITSNKLKPEILWKDSEDKKHRYFPDFYIPKDNLIIEIKSIYTYTLDSKQEKIEKTTKAVKELGYKYEIWILNQKGEILYKY